MLDAGDIDIEGDDIDGGPGRPVGVEHVLGAECLQALQHGHDRNQNHGGLEQRQRDAPEDLPLGGPINGCSLIDGRRDGGKTGDEENDKVSYVLPEVDHHRGDLFHDWVNKPTLVHPRGAEQGVYPLVAQSARIEDDHPDGCCNHTGENGRTVVGNLQKLLGPVAGKIADEYGNHQTENQEGDEGAQGKDQGGTKAVVE
ncbi:hypothetical protein SDC9_87038 [bioreactor metagenome]|uniref:Uncharacterized protein n=1 Tax=bioreactor metagenome TaxID=1076179 RepID=A0A644ZJ86_9ZZZZ